MAGDERVSSACSRNIWRSRSKSSPSTAWAARTASSGPRSAGSSASTVDEHEDRDVGQARRDGQLLRLEVAEEGGPADAGRGGDLVDRRGGDAVRRRQPHGLVGDAAAGLGALALPESAAPPF